jgi:hypothetical protein
MPTCGSITATIAPGTPGVPGVPGVPENTAAVAAAPATQPAPGVTDTDRFATGYFCPVYPERLHDRPQICPLDQTPYKFVRIEKVLTVAESAVIDTGAHKVVYREAGAPGSGVFDMLEVTLGPRVGEFYPVLSGLQPGDRVATQGAFLVDAENRLNPGAAAQFFGASGGSSTEHKH